MGGAEALSLLRKRIAAMRPGDRFPSVRELMRELGVGQVVVTHALSALQREGLIRSQVGKGTFVCEHARLRTVLWVCGIDLFHGDINPFYSQELRFVKAECQRSGLSLDTAWISNFRPEDSASYCAPAVLERYVGFIFSGCHPEHRFMNYVLRNETVPSVCSTFWPPHPRAVSPDYPQLVELGFGHLKSKGHTQVSFFAPVNAFGDESMPRRTAARLDLRVQHVPYDLVSWTADYQKQGYRLTTELLKARRLTPGIFIQDDVVALGVTRALLARCSPGRRAKLDIVVGGAMQSIVPLGLPVMRAVWDIEDSVGHAMAILMNQIEGRVGKPDTYCVPAVLIKDTAGAVKEKEEEITPPGIE